MSAALALLLALAGDAALPGTLLSRRDILRLHYPLRVFVAHEYGAGRLPTWNPLDGLGVSMPGSAVAAAFHPLQVLLAVLPPDVALKWQVLLCVFLAGLGAALLARRNGLAESAQWLAGIGYGASGYVLSSTDNFTYLHGAALLPWVLWAAERLGAAPTARRSVELAGLLTLGLLGGDIQGTLLATVLAVTWALLLAPQRRRAFFFILISGVLTVLLTAPLLPAIAATALESGRAAGLAADEALKWSLHPLRLLELPLGPLVSLDVMNASGARLAPALGGHTGAFWAASEFLGAVLVVLAPFGLRRGEAAPLRRYALLALVALVLSLGREGGLYALLLEVVPGWSAFRYPEKLMPLAVLGLCLLAARAVVVTPPRVVLIAAAVLGALLLPFAAVLEPEGVDALFRGLGSPGLDAASSELIAVGLRARASLAVLVCLGLGLVAWRKPAALGWAAVALLSVQSVWCARGLLGTEPRSLITTPSALLEPALRSGAQRTHLAAYPGDYEFRGERFEALKAIRLGDVTSLSPAFAMASGVSNLSPYLPGSMGEIERACGLRPVCTSVCARRLGAGLCVVNGSSTARLVERGAVELARVTQPSLVLLEDPLARPWASFPGVRPYTGELKAALGGPGSFALELDGVRSFEAAPDGVTAWQRPRPDLAEIDVELPSPNLLVLAEQCARGWSAQVDGAQTKPARVDGGLCAVEVPAGAHHVTLQYVPPGWPFAWALFALGVVASALALRRETFGSP